MKSKQAQDRKELAVAMAAGRAIGRLTHSRLMSPTEIDAALRHRADLRGNVDGWCLCTEAPDAMWQRALEVHNQGVPHYLVVTKTPTGRCYFTVVIQAANWQHRVCVPLLGDFTAQWVLSLASGKPLVMSLANADSDRALVWQAAVPADAIAQLQGVDTRLPSDLSAVMEEASMFVAWNARLGYAEPVAEMQPPDEVTVSLLLPAEVEASLERSTEEWAERKPN